jgi:hypothetical protein
MSRSYIVALVSLAALAATTPAQAQGPSFAPNSTTYEHLAALRQQAAIPVVTSAAVVSGKSRRSGALLMIVGVAGIVTGLVVDEPVVTIAGAVVGGIGLYMYLDNSRSVRVGMRQSLPSFGS